MPESSHSLSSCRILWSTQSGRAKACARRTARIIAERTNLPLQGGIGCPFDETAVPFLELLTSPLTADGTLFLMFVSTTGDGEQCDSIRNTWKSLLQKSLPRNLLASTTHTFALFCLGDRAYGPQFCAAGRKLAVRLLQLGMKTHCEVGYGDDNTPKGGVFRDLDEWLDIHLIPSLNTSSSSLMTTQADKEGPSNLPCHPYRIHFLKETNETQASKSAANTKTNLDDAPQNVEWKKEPFKDSYRDYFTARGPIAAYSYDDLTGTRILGTNKKEVQNGIRTAPLQSRVVVNNRITASEWKQNTRQLEIRISQQLGGTFSRGANAGPNNTITSTKDKAHEPLPYMAGDVASILPFNSAYHVNRFLGVLPESIASLSNTPLRIVLDNAYATDNRFTKWPETCTLRGWLTYCADIQALPEREDLRALSFYCSREVMGEDASLDQSEKLKSLSETSEAALYADYILREKRSWIDVFYDFQSLREAGTRLNLEGLFMLLPPIRTRDFSIASSPSMQKIHSGFHSHTKDTKKMFSIELCVAVVEGTTRLGRSYHGLCSKFLSQRKPSDSKMKMDGSFSSTEQDEILLWIRPGTFGKMPTQISRTTPSSFEVPIICVGSGTGIAPMRSLILERVAIRALALGTDHLENIEIDCKSSEVWNETVFDEDENVLVFGCRKRTADYYYKEEWETLTRDRNIRLLTAFSQDQNHKVYVQKILREADDRTLITRHILERGGAIFIAGGPKMARGVKQEIVEALSDALSGGETQANKFLSKMQRMGKFNIEAWS